MTLDDLKPFLRRRVRIEMVDGEVFTGYLDVPSKAAVLTLGVRIYELLLSDSHPETRLFGQPIDEDFAGAIERIDILVE